MAMFARLKSIVGGNPPIGAKTVAAAATLIIPDDLSVIPLTGTATVTALRVTKHTRARMLWFRQSDSGATTFTNTPGSTTAEEMDLGALDPANTVLSNTDWLCLWVRPDGVAERVFHTNN